MVNIILNTRSHTRSEWSRQTHALRCHQRSVCSAPRPLLCVGGGVGGHVMHGSASALVRMYNDQLGDGLAEGVMRVSRLVRCGVNRQHGVQ